MEAQHEVHVAALDLRPGPGRTPDLVRTMNAPARSSGALLRMAGRIARFGGWTIELPERKLSWSDEVYEMLGYVIGEAPGSLQARLDLYAAGQTEAQARRKLEVQALAAELASSSLGPSRKPWIVCAPA